MKNKRYGSVLGIEDLQEEVLNGEGDEIVIEDDGVSELPEIEDETIEDTDAADVLEEAVDQIEEVAEGLEALREQMAVALSNGGMDKQSAMFAKTAAIGICGRWANPEDIIPSLESFDEVGGRMAATSYSMETINEKIVKVADKIGEFITEWGKRIINFFLRLVNASEGLMRSGGMLASRANKMRGAEEDKHELSVSSTVIKSLSVNGKVHDVAGALSGLKTKITALRPDSAAGDLVRILIDELKTTDLSSTEKAEATYEKIAKGKLSLEAVAGTFKSDSPFALTEEKKGNRIILTSPSLIGNIKVCHELEGNGKNVFTKMTTRVVVDHTSNSSLKVLPALSAKEIAELGISISQLMTAVKQSKTSAKARNALIKELMTENKRVSKELAKITVSGEVFHTLKAAIAGSAQTAMAIMQPDLALQRQAIASARAAYQYGVLSLKNLKKRK